MSNTRNTTIVYSATAGYLQTIPAPSTDPTIDTIQDAIQSPDIPVPRDALPDVQQSAWQSLLQRASTDWLHSTRLRSQARNAVNDASRQHYRQSRYDKRTTLSALQWSALESPQHAPLHPHSPDPETLADTTRLLGRIFALKLTRHRKWCPQYRALIVQELHTQFLAHPVRPTTSDVQRAEATVISRDIATLID